MKHQSVTGRVEARLGAGAARESASALKPTHRSSCANAARTRDQCGQPGTPLAGAASGVGIATPASRCAIKTAAMIASKSCASSTVTA